MKYTSKDPLRVAVIGGGAAGFFAALSVKAHYPNASVTLYEKSQKLLAKVRISGGGRCNVTNGSVSIKELSSAYPRGGKLMKKALNVFNTNDTRAWFESRGVKLKIESDNRVFPVSDDSSSIVDCLKDEAVALGIDVLTREQVLSINSLDYGLQICTNDQKVAYDKVIVASGGSPKKSGFDWLASLGHKIEEPVPSLFTFNMPSEGVRKLMGVVAEDVLVSIQGTKLRSNGPLLITHWGMSGPAILRLSAFGARILFDLGYQFHVQVNWVKISNNEEVLTYLKALSGDNPKKLLSNVRPFNLPQRLCNYLLNRCQFAKDKRWQDLGKKGYNKLVTTLTHDIYKVEGKTTFKEEFVTCGGVSLDSINRDTMESLEVPNLYFAGEVLDIDGITGGYNFQAAWTIGFIAGKLL